MSALPAMICKTVCIEDLKAPGGYVIINESDLKPGMKVIERPDDSIGVLFNEGQAPSYQEPVIDRVVHFELEPLWEFVAGLLSLKTGMTKDQWMALSLDSRLEQVAEASRQVSDDAEAIANAQVDVGPSPEDPDAGWRDLHWKRQLQMAKRLGYTIDEEPAEPRTVLLAREFIAKVRGETE